MPLEAEQQLHLTSSAGFIPLAEKAVTGSAKQTRSCRSIPLEMMR